MNIIVLTSSMTNEDFNDFAGRAKIKPNPSNQNFYNKLIKAFGVFNSVSVVSLRPFVKGMFDEDYLDSRTSAEGTIKYYYPYLKATKNFKAFKQAEEIAETVDHVVLEQGYDSFILVVDTLRFALLKAAKLIIKKYNCFSVGVITDNPANLSGVNPAYISQIKKNVSDFDAYIALSETLNRVLNIKKQPAYIVEGLVEDAVTSPRLPINDYIFFGGALYERFGVRHLVDAFHKSSSSLKLVIAGTGELRKYISDLADKDRRILYLGLLDKETIYTLEQQAVMNINPRPYDWKMDRESVPSKLLEYFASGAPTMSTKHTRLMELFTNTVIWLDNDSEAYIERAIESIDTMDKSELKKKAASTRTKVYELYGIRTQGELMTHFLMSVKDASTK